MNANRSDRYVTTTNVRGESSRAIDFAQRSRDVFRDNSSLVMRFETTGGESGEARNEPSNQFVGTKIVN